MLLGDSDSDSSCLGGEGEGAEVDREISIHMFPAHTLRKCINSCPVEK